MTPTTTPTPSEAPRAVSDGLARLCKEPGCRRERAKDAAYCREHLTDAWMNRLPAWLRRVEDPEAEGATMGLRGKDYTGSAA